MERVLVENAESLKENILELTSTPVIAEKQSVTIIDSSNLITSGLVQEITGADVLTFTSGTNEQVVNSAHISSDVFLSKSQIGSIEQSILHARNPLDFNNENESLTVQGNTGIWLNKSEILNWKGEVPITEYQINEDATPEIIRKQTEQRIVYEQEVAIRYLKPPTPPPPGEIFIKQEKNSPTAPAPPLVLRQVPPRPDTPPPLVIREAPPKPPIPVGQKVITISGKRIPPPPRKVVIERLAPIPSKPQSALIERWLPFTQQKRRVIFQKNLEPDPVVVKPKNIIIQWEAPAVQIKKSFKDLGVIRANPVEYVQRYGTSLKTHNELPQFVKEIRPPTGVILAAEYTAPSLIELEGDVQALNLIDLDREGLKEYRTFLTKFGSTTTTTSTTHTAPSITIASAMNAVLAELFQSVDTNSSGHISRSEAETLLIRLNSRLGRRYSEEDAKIFFASLDSNNDGIIDFNEFRAALIKQLV